MAGPDFPRAEYESRLAAIQTSMHGANLDALFFTSEAEMRYFTGFRTLFWQSPTRPWFLVVPRSGMPVAVIPEIGADLMRSAFVGKVRSWASPHPDDDGLSLLVDALRPHARVGMMIGRETALRMPLADFETLRTGLAGCEFTDATAMVQRQRMVKSEAEIALIGEICSIASKSFEAAPQLFREGQTLSDAFRAFKIELLKNGAEDVPYLVGGAGQGGYGDVISPPGEDRLEAGDVLMLDTGATLHGYFCDFDRNFAIGHASADARLAHDTLWRATEAALAVARPGATCRDLFEAMAAIVGDNGGDVGRYGHGIGMQLTEPPSLAGFDETVVQPGMV
ncbi:MAG: aminopeptidase P family protein, partial [Oricola sp.]|nr:aminopeptidase P family protein [Oricola sp.]